MLRQSTLALTVFVLTVAQAVAQTVIPITSASYNWDAIAETTPPAATTTSPGLDGSAYVLYAQSYPGNPGGGFSNSQMITVSGNTYQLQPYNGNNALRVVVGSPGTLVLQTSQVLSSVFLLATSTEGASPIQITINHTDATTTALAATSIPDWVGGAGGVSVGQRVSRNDGLFSATAKVYQVGGALSGPNVGKPVQSITITRTGTGGGRAYIFGVVGVTVCSPPVFTQCPSSLTGVCNTAVTYTASAPGATSLSFTLTGATTGSGSGTGSGTFFNAGVTNVVITATNACGSATCSFSVTVSVNSTPTITCPAGITQTAAPQVCGSNVTFANPVATDNACAGTVTVTQIGGPASGSFFPIGVTTVTFRAQNSGGNSSTCSFTVTVLANTTPTIACPANITQNAATGLCGSNVTFANPVASDPCALPVTVTQLTGPASGAFFPVGVTTVTFRAQNSLGNSATCSFTVSVLDTQTPSAVCPPDQTVLTTGFTCVAESSTINLGAPTIVDNCGSGAPPTNNAPTSFPLGTTTVVWTVYDGANQSATCVQNITVIDLYQPVVQCPESVQATADPATCTAVIDYAVTAYDNCGAVTLSYNHPPLSDFQLDYTQVTVTATDGSGNASTCSFLVQVGRAQEVCNDLDDDCDGLTDEADDWQNVGRRLASDGLAGEQYGTSVDVAGDYAVVGSRDKDAGGQTVGGAYLMHRNADGTWEELTKFVPQGVDAGDDLGAGVAIDGGWLALGAPGDDDVASNAGAIYVYRQSGSDPGQWVEFAKLTLATANVDDKLGAGLALHGDYLLAGAVGDDQASADAGAVYVFARNQGGANNWGLVTKLMAPFGATDDQFGAHIDFDGAHAIVSASDDDQYGSDAGAAYIFGKNAGGTDSWGLVIKLTAGDGDADDNFGSDVAISGDFAMVGANQQDDKGTDAGKVYVFYRNQWSQQNSWGQLQGMLDFNGKAGDNFGTAVAMEAEYAVVGAPGADFLNNLVNAGKAIVYQRQQSGYVPVDQLTPSPQRAEARFGSVLAMSDRTILAGVGLDDQNTQLDRGSVTFFESVCAGSENREEVPAADQLKAGLRVQTFPVPFADQLTIRLEGSTAARVTVLNNLGQEIAVIHDGSMPAEGAQFQWQAGRSQPGLYFVRVQTTDAVQTKAVMLAR